MFSDFQNAIENELKIEFNKEQHLVTERIAFQIKEMFAEAGREALFLRNAFAIIKLVEAMDSGSRKEMTFWKEGVEKVCLPLLNTHTIPHSIKFIDNDGNEIVGVKKTDNGGIAIDKPYLKNVSNDPLFKEAIKLDNDDLYTSRSFNLVKTGTPVYHLNTW
jgi:hypothetical protein